MKSVVLISLAVLAGAQALDRSRAAGPVVRCRRLHRSRPRSGTDRLAQIRHWIDGRRGRAHDRLVAALPEAIELVARALRSGSSLSQALAEAAAATNGSLGAALDRIVTGTQRGEALTHALARFVEGSPRPEVRVAGAALAMAAEAGGGPSRALDGVSESLRDRERLGREIAALTSQARTSAIVLIGLPVVFVLVYGAVDGSALSFLLQDDLGRLCLIVGLALDLVGWLWMRRLVTHVRA